MDKGSVPKSVTLHMNLAHGALARTGSKEAYTYTYSDSVYHGQGGIATHRICLQKGTLPMNLVCEALAKIGIVQGHAHQVQQASGP